MKKTILIITALLMTVTVFSQRKELRQASKEIKNSSFEEAKQILSSIESQISTSDEGSQAEFYLYKGQAFFGAAGNNQEDLLTATSAFEKVIEIETSGRQKYTKDAQENIQALLVRLVNSAIEDQTAEKYSEASQKLHAGYSISKKDTVYLYFAATNAMSAQEFDNAEKYYKELLDLGYTGIGKEYVATDKETGEVVSFGNKEEQNLMMMSGNYIKPEERMSESKRPTILRDLGFIYIENGNVEEAKKMIADARSTNPDDIGLIRAEANIALQMEDMKTYNALMQKVVASDPDNPELFYNLGVSAASIGDLENARKHYNKALELDPDFINAKVNLAVMILDQEQGIIDEMNSLGTSPKDNKRYDELREERNEMYLEAVPYLESALEGKPNDLNIIRTLMNIYSILGEDSKFNQMKSRMEALEN